MLVIKFKKCCYKCAHRKTLVKEATMHYGYSIQATETRIYCEHKEVCKEYRESEE